jgi:membrane carboxypeptidase/penicillin-binding protein
MTPASMIEDTPLSVGDWTPKNYGNEYRGRITLRDAFAVSSNVAAVRLSERVGRENVIRAARDLGVTAELDNQRSLPLGTSSMSLMDLVEAYAAVAAGSYPVQARGLPEVEESWYDRMMSRQNRMGGIRGASCSNCCTHPSTRAPVAPRRCRWRASARPARRRTAAMLCSSALPAIW